jgi:anti-anti-sigma regulatory factor
MYRQRTYTPFFVHREDDVIYIDSLEYPKCASQFIENLRDGIKKGYDNFELDFSHVNAAFPNAVVPMAGIIDYHRNNGIVFEYNSRSLPANVSVTRILHPLSLPENVAILNKNALNKVWRFQGSFEIKQIVDAYIAELRKEARFEAGALMAIEWSINEVMDNVIQHSQADCGYIMGQLHGNSQNIAFTIFDIGQGIYNSLKDSEHRPRKPIDALTLCIQEEVTRDKKVGQGNGLFGLFSVVKQGAGRLTLTSGGGSYMYNRGSVKTYHDIPYVISNKQPGTIVDFQLNYASGLSLEKALVFRGKPYEMTDLFIEGLEDEKGFIQYKIVEHSEGTGTREAAIRVKNEIFNIIKDSGKPIVLDFDGVNISSSFADELIAKIFMEMGLFQFNNAIRIRNMDKSQQLILQRSVMQRIIDDFKK